MGGSEGSEGGIGVDCGVGTIVWVRRRNGSWWPGRILGPEELSASHLMSPRSGTPVKLLGREDASVDWYNLEKSKRVKAFRCGEFDACIERAEASQGIPIKKREKYARREDAILHALELEKKQLEMKQQKSGIVSNGVSSKSLSTLRRENNSFSASEHYVRKDPGLYSKSSSHKPQLLSRKADLQIEENASNSLYVQKGKHAKQSGWEEDNPESMPRMRGLQDFGLRTAPLRRKLSQSVGWGTTRKHGDNHVSGFSSAGQLMEGARYAGGSKSSLLNKRKRSHSMAEESLVKRRDRRRPLVQVLQSSAKLPVSNSSQSDQDAGGVAMQGETDNMGFICRAKRSRCVYMPADSSDSLEHLGYPPEEMPIGETQFGMDSLAEEYTSSALMESTESDSSETDYLEPDLTEDADLSIDAAENLVPRSDNSGKEIVHGPDSYQGEGCGDLNSDDGPLPSYMTQMRPLEQTVDESTEVGVSKWHIKGKRNIRSLAKRPMDVVDGRITTDGAAKCNGSNEGTTYGTRWGSSKLGRTESSSQRTSGRGYQPKKEDISSSFNEGDLGIRELARTHLTEYDRSYPLLKKAFKERSRPNNSFNDSDNDLHMISPPTWEADDPYHVPHRAYWDDSDEYPDQVYGDHIGNDFLPMLVNVNLKVQASSYQGEHVPLVSLMSRLNGKAIIGHPVQIEILEDGSTSPLVSRGDAGIDDSGAPPPVWRTARRTAMQRVPRSNPGTAALECEDAEALQLSDLESKHMPKKSYSSVTNHQVKVAKKGNSHVRRSASGKSQRKLMKRVSLSSQKIRTLSSISTERKLGGENADVKRARAGDILGGLIKPEGVMPLVTCVPSKVVFSRILEVVGRPPASAALRARMTSTAARDQSGL